MVHDVFIQALIFWVGNCLFLFDFSPHFKEKMSLLALGSPPRQQTFEGWPVLPFGGSSTATAAVEASVLGL